MTVPRPEALLFDAGGTLVHMSPEAAGDLLEPLTGRRPDPDRMLLAHYTAMEAVAARPDVSTISHDVLWRAWTTAFLETVGFAADEEAIAVLAAARGMWTRPIPGAADALRRLRDDGYRVAVVSNSDGTVREALAIAGFDGAAEFVVDSYEEEISKPDPAIFAIALERLGIPAPRAWYVGDSRHHDVGGGHAAGLAEVVLVDPFDLIPGYEPRVASVVEVPGLLDRITS